MTHKLLAFLRTATPAGPGATTRRSRRCADKAQHGPAGEPASRHGCVALVAGVLIALLAGCGSGSVDWQTRNITGTMPDLAFTLTRGNGETVHAGDFAGSYDLLYFGYTHCPDVCPATLAILDAALDKLGKQADRVRVLFVSVDPKRDTPQALASYVSAFGPRVVGLTGTHAQLTELTRRYRVAYRLGDPDSSGDYPVYHSAGIFVFDPQGNARLLMNYKDGVDAIAHDLSALIQRGE